MGEERRDDWRHSVDESLVNLTTAQKVTDRQLDDIEVNLTDVDKLIRGDTERETSGLIGRTETLEHQISVLNAVIFTDAAGKHGLQHDVKELKEARSDRRTTLENWTKIIVALIMSGLIGHFWQDIRGFLNRKSTDPVDQMIENAVHPKPKHRHYTIRETPPEE